MPDRLDELRRQRALVQEHLAWLEREIAAADGRSAAPPGPTVGAGPQPSSAAVTASPSSPAEARVDDILARYRSAPGTVKQDVRKGCLLYFALALIVFAGGVAILYFTLGPR